MTAYLPQRMLVANSIEDELLMTIMCCSSALSPGLWHKTAYIDMYHHAQAVSNIAQGGYKGT